MTPPKAAILCEEDPQCGGFTYKVMPDFLLSALLCLIVVFHSGNLFAWKAVPGLFLPPSDQPGDRVGGVEVELLPSEQDVPPVSWKICLHRSLGRWKAWFVGRLLQRCQLCRDGASHPPPSLLLGLRQPEESAGRHHNGESLGCARRHEHWLRKLLGKPWSLLPEKWEGDGCAGGQDSRSSGEGAVWHGSGGDQLRPT